MSGASSKLKAIYVGAYTVMAVAKTVFVAPFWLTFWMWLNSMPGALTGLQFLISVCLHQSGRKPLGNGRISASKRISPVEPLAGSWKDSLAALINNPWWCTPVSVYKRCCTTLYSGQTPQEYTAYFCIHVYFVLFVLAMPLCVCVWGLNPIQTNIINIATFWAHKNFSAFICSNFIKTQSLVLCVCVWGLHLCVRYLAECPLCSSWERPSLARPSYGPSSSDPWDNRPHSESECVCL